MKLSELQRRAVDCLRTGPMSQEDFYGVDIRLPTVRSLVRLGLVDRIDGEQRPLSNGGTYYVPKWRLNERLLNN